MVVLRFVYRFLGVLWAFVGIAILIAQLPLMAVRSWLSRLIVTNLPRLADVFDLQSVSLVLGAREVAAIALGVFCVFFGLGLLTLRSWARTVGIAFHVAIGACLAALALVLYARLAPPDQATRLTESVATTVLAAGGTLSVLLVALGFQMSASASTDAFMGQLPALPKTVPAKCPTCGGPLDLTKARCPKCDTELDVPRSPKRAKLVDAQAGREYTVSLRKLNRVGREMPGFEIQPENRSVSGDHASIEYHQGHFYLHAHDDTFGTFVNGRSTRECEIKHNDVIQFGQAEFRFVVEY
ncbi:MAG: FHA domain-containing protein [Chloroflexi bacterium]|nr:FHA domain-containing protein [Chloroflexota bacterium]